ncbi:MAG TPA: ABC transporter ATP-binding protein [Myxococcota bacterium]|nr:ABC transporter ATP-binding protein [Myxococcota bacterium]
MGETLLEAREATKVYRAGEIETVALSNVDLAVERGEFSALSGPSGSGKTTLLNLLGTLDRPTSGRILVAGLDTTEMREAARAELRLRKLGFVFQAYNLVPVLSALENVEFVLLLQHAPHDERRARARRVLEEVGLGALAEKRPNEMSGGQQQRVAVARAIASEPEIVLADEPTANLDSKTAEDLLDLMERMNRERGVTFLFSTHDPRVMARARRTIRLVDGRIASDERRAV